MQEKPNILNKLEALGRSELLQKLLAPGMRRFWALALVCVLVLVCVLAAGGGGAKLPPEPVPVSAEPTATVPATEPPAPAAPTGLTELSGLEILPEESVCGLFRDGDGAGVLLLRWDDEAQVWRGRLAALDPQRAAVRAVTELEPFGELRGFSAPVLTDTEFRLVDRSLERCLAFDRAGRFLGIKDHPVMSPENLGWRNRLLSDGCFRKEAAWAEFSRGDSGALNRVLAFYDEPDRLRVVGEPYDQIRDAAGHRVLCLRTEEGGQELALLDLDAALCLDRLPLRPETEAEPWINLDHALLGEDWALLALSEDSPESVEKRLCFWYPEAGKESPIETETLTEQDLADGVEVLRQQLEAQGLALRLDEAPAAERTPTTGLSVSESLCETGASLFGQYWILTELERFAEKLPAGMLRELTAAPGQDPAEAEPLQVYVVRSIPGDASAFASAWLEPALICFATEEFGPAHLAHELMHVMDLRLSRYLQTQGRDLEPEWMKLSPDWAYEPNLSQEQYDELQDDFVSAYAMTDAAEDRAETFQALFDSEEPAAEQWWYAAHPGAQAKVRWLIETVRAAFPSVQTTDRAYWEKLPPEEAG